MRMTLAEKGPIAPPPYLEGQLQGVSQAIQSWPGVIAATHWHLYRPTEVDGADFYVGEEELGHIHIYGVAHIATSKRLGEAILAHGLGERLPFSGYEAWTSRRIANAEQAELALWLFALNYRRLCGEPEVSLLSEIAARVDEFKNAINQSEEKAL